MLSILEDHLSQIKELQESYYPDKKEMPKTAEQIGKIMDIEMALRLFLLQNTDKIDDAKELIDNFVNKEEESGYEET